MSVSESKAKIRHYQKLLEKIIVNDSYFAIISALKWYNTLTLSQLGIFLDKPKSTVLRYLKQLLEGKVIEINPEEHVGKYYRNSRETVKLFAFMETAEGESQLIPIDYKTTKHLEFLASIIKSTAIASKSMSFLAAKFIEKVIPKYLNLKEEDDPLKNSKGNMNISMHELKLTTVEQLEKYNDLVNKFVNDLRELETESNQDNPIDTPYTQLISLTSLNIEKFHPKGFD